ncbi:MAG: hypothetical protein Q9164_006074 [Protoblastenia rupestris]
MIAFASNHPSSLPSFRDLKTRQQPFVAFGLILLFIFCWSNVLPRRVPHLSSYHLKELEDAISNSTLGFQKIYALALPDRKDRIRPLLEAANATNISVTVLNAVRDAEISNDSWPNNWNQENHRVGELGCLVSHVRTWNKMITQNITSALVLESDADWDLRLKPILHALPPAITTLIDFPFPNPPSPLTPPNNPNPLHRTQLTSTLATRDNPQSNPYASHLWDIIWLGHCGSSAEGSSRYYMWNDTTTPPPGREYTFDIGLQPTQHRPGERSLFIFGRTTCSSAYAISLQGAKKLVNYFKEADQNLDVQLSRFCTGNADMICLGIWPQIFTAANTVSNIGHSGQGDKAPGDEEEEGDKPKPGPGIQFSARVNAEVILRDGKGQDEWKAEWDSMWAARNGSWAEVKLNRTEAFR